jgi:hypothetical protein
MVALAFFTSVVRFCITISKVAVVVSRPLSITLLIQWVKDGKSLIVSLRASQAGQKTA